MENAAKKENWQERRDRIERAMFEMKLTLEEFAAKCTVSFDDRFKWYEWRVRGDETLADWIFDAHRDRSEEKYTDEQVIEFAYHRFCDIQARKGQINWNSVYVRGVEDVYAVAPKPGGNVAINTAQVYIVQDSVDKIWRFAINYFAVSGGCSFSPAFDRYKTDTRENAILKGAEMIRSSVIKDWQRKDEKDAYKPFINKLENFIESVKSEIRQPSLFD